MKRFVITLALVLASCSKSDSTTTATMPIDTSPQMIRKDLAKQPVCDACKPCPIIPPCWRCDGARCWDATPEEHSHSTMTFPDNPFLKLETSEMMSESWIEVPPETEKQNPGLTEELRAKAKMPPLARVGELRHFISRETFTHKDAVRKLGKSVCLYVKRSSGAFWDRDLKYSTGVGIFSGVFPVLEGTTAAVVKTLVPVKDGYVVVYLESSAFTQSTEDAVDYDRTSGILDSSTPELCPTEWPHAHHWPLRL